MTKDRKPRRAFTSAEIIRLDEFAAKQHRRGDLKKLARELGCSYYTIQSRVGLIPNERALLAAAGPLPSSEGPGSVALWSACSYCQ